MIDGARCPVDIRLARTETECRPTQQMKNQAGQITNYLIFAVLGVNGQETHEPASLGFPEKKENIAFLGSGGVGKHILGSIHWNCRCKKYASTYFIECNDLLQQSKKTQPENHLETGLKQAG